MAFKFNKAVFSTQTEWNYETIGVLKDIIKGRKIKFIKKNLKTDKRVTLLISDKTGSYDNADILSCTVPLSKVVRKALESKSQKEVLEALVKLQVQQDTENPEKYFLFQPQGDGEMLPGFSVDELSKSSTTVEDLVSVLGAIA